MIRLKPISSKSRLKHIPAMILEHIQHIDSDIVLWLNGDDDLTDIPELGPDGLYEAIDNEWIGFDHVLLHTVGHKRIFELLIIPDSTMSVTIFLEDGPSLDETIRTILMLESQ